MSVLGREGIVCRKVVDKKRNVRKNAGKMQKNR